MAKTKPRITIYQLRAEIPEGQGPQFSLTPVEVIDAGRWLRRSGGNNLRRFMDFNIVRWHKRDGVLIFQKWLFDVADEGAVLADFCSEVERQLTELVEKQKQRFWEAKAEYESNALRLQKFAENRTHVLV